MDSTLNHEQHASTWGEAIGKLLLLLLILKWSYTLLSPVLEIPWIILDSANLLIHEAGHFIFFLLGEFIGMLGGSLLQLLIPVVFGIYFAQRMSWFALFFCLFWLGDNFTNVARYIMDSRAQQLPLIGGEGSNHDWNWLLTRMNVLPYDLAIGNVVYFFGAICIVISLLLMIIDIYYSFRHIGLLQKTVE